jgi:hypothetical protein
MKTAYQTTIEYLEKRIEEIDQSLSSATSNTLKEILVDEK